MLAYDAGSAIGDPIYEIGFEHLFSTARRAMRPQIDVYDSTSATSTTSTGQAPSQLFNVS